MRGARLHCWLGVLSCAAAASVPNVELRLSTRPLDLALSSVGAQVAALIDSYPVPTCCYDDVEKKASSPLLLPLLIRISPSTCTWISNE